MKPEAGAGFRVAQPQREIGCAVDAKQLRERAQHFRQLANEISDDRARAAALALATEYDELADAVARGEAPDGGETTATQTMAADRGT